MNHRFKLHQQTYEETQMYSVIRETDAPLIERLPDNKLVELYPNRIGIYFEIDQMPSALVHARVPTNYITLVCNAFFFAGCIIAFGLFLVRQCATRALHRELLTILGIDNEHNYDPTLSDELKYIFLGRFHKGDPEDNALMHQLFDKLDLANLLRDFENVYEKVIGKRPRNPNISVIDQLEEDDNRQILYSSMARSTLKDESEVDVTKFEQEEAKRKA